MSLYVALDGGDGCGKSSQATALCEWLHHSGRRVLHVREPGSTPVGEALRQLLLGKGTGELRPLTEALLFSAARAELVGTVIAPARARGDIVVAERCWLSTIVYQALASPSAVAVDWVVDVTRRAHGSCLPDAVFVLDVAPVVAAHRRRARAADRFEGRGDDYHRGVRDGFLRAAALEPRAEVVDASRSFGAVHTDLSARVQRLLAAGPA